MNRKLFTVVALLCATTVSLTAQNVYPDWYKNEDFHFKAVENNSEANFSILAVGYIDGVRCDYAYELGIFCNEECRSSEPFFKDLAVFDEYGYLAWPMINGKSGESFHFRLYDHRHNVEVEAAIVPEEVAYVSDAILGDFGEFYELAFTGSTTHRNALTIDDATNLPYSGKQYGITADGIACSYTRNAYLDGGYETIVLPFDADITSIKVAGFVFEKFEGFGDNTIKFVELDEGENLKAGVPYLFRYSGTPSKDRKEIVFSGSPQQVNDAIVTNEGWTGTFKSMDGNEIAGKYILNTNGDKMQIAGSGASLKPYHCYLELSAGTNVSTLSVSHRRTHTGVESMVVQDNSEEIFDMLGRKLDEMPTSGIVIMNNKKIYIK